MKRRPLLSWVVGLVVASAVASGSDAGAAATARFESSGGKLSVRAEKTPVGEVLSAVEKETGVRFSIDPELAKKAVTVDLKEVALERAIRAVVAAIPEAAGTGMSFVRDDGAKVRLASVRVFPIGKGKPGAVDAQAVTASTEPERKARVDRGRERDSDDKRAVPANLRERLYEGLDPENVGAEEAEIILGRATELTEEIATRPSPTLHWDAIAGTVPAQIAPGAEGVMPLLRPNPDGPAKAGGAMEDTQDALAPEAADIIERQSEARAGI